VISRLEIFVLVCLAIAAALFVYAFLA